MKTFHNKASNIALLLKKKSLNYCSSDKENALYAARQYGKFLWANHIGQYADIDFEEKIYSAIKNKIVCENLHKKHETIHIISSAKNWGGHGRAVVRMINEGLGSALCVVDTIPDETINQIRKDVVFHQNIRSQSGIETIQKIIGICNTYRNIILHIHPDDIYSAMAAVALSRIGVKVLFYNHADHAFSFGYFAANYVLEISKYGWTKGVQRKIKHKQSFVGIPISKITISKKRDRIFENNQAIGLFAGTVDKFNPWRGYNACIFLNQLFEKNKHIHLKILVCGQDSNKRIWDKLSEKAKDNTIFIGRLNHPDYLKTLSSVDFYIDSFPMGNGTGFSEAVSCLVPSFGLDLLAGCSPADCLRSQSLNQLTDSITSYIENPDDNEKFLKAQELVLEEQHIKVIVNRISNIIKNDIIIELPDCYKGINFFENFFEHMWNENKVIKIYPYMLFSGSFLPNFHIILEVIKSIKYLPFKMLTKKLFMQKTFYKFI